MTEYTWDDIIINPNSEEAKNAIGKECYFSKRPFLCLQHANENDESFLGIVESSMEKDEPFGIEDGSNWTCIIVKKEEPEPKYVPFESPQEFISAYYKASKEVMQDTESMLSNFGMWLKGGEHYELVTHIHNNGIIIDDISINWKTLFDFYKFLDGSLCGKLMEDNND